MSGLFVHLMRGSIDLDRQLGRRAMEVEDAGADGMLFAKPEPVQPIALRLQSLASGGVS